MTVIMVPPATGARGGTAPTSMTGSTYSNEADDGPKSTPLFETLSPGVDVVSSERAGTAQRTCALETNVACTTREPTPHVSVETLWKPAPCSSTMRAPPPAEPSAGHAHVTVGGAWYAKLSGTLEKWTPSLVTRTGTSPSAAVAGATQTIAATVAATVWTESASTSVTSSASPKRHAHRVSGEAARLALLLPSEAVAAASAAAAVLAWLMSTLTSVPPLSGPDDGSSSSGSGGAR